MLELLHSNYEAENPVMTPLTFYSYHYKSEIQIKVVIREGFERRMNEMYERSMMGSHELEADVRMNEEEGSAGKNRAKKQNGKGGWRARKKSSSKKVRRIKKQKEVKRCSNLYFLILPFARKRDTWCRRNTAGPTEFLSFLFLSLPGGRTRRVDRVSQIWHFSGTINDAMADLFRRGPAAVRDKLQWQAALTSP